MDFGYPYMAANRRRCVKNHRNEYLLYGGIAADDYRVLACFWGDEATTTHIVSLSPFPGETTKYPAKIPQGTSINTENGDLTEELKLEVYSNIGLWDERKFCCLALALCSFWEP
ncbi:hypothetical protein LX36DRAFT_662422 [Colletotrichum falcatum]|nr:hypothetical protein LX36DRAFT_662422 [Colletotrichum falcatum]